MNSFQCFERQKNIFSLSIVALLGFLFSLTSFAQASIEVFVDKPMSVANIPNVSVTVFDLSRVAEVKKSLPHFSGNQMQATAQAKTWLDSPAGKDHIESVKAAYVGHEKMVHYQLKKIPAIVFDHGQFVIYGTTDLQQAMEDYGRYLHEHSNTEDIKNVRQK